MKKNKPLRKKRSVLPQLKKEIVDFLLSEEGRITEKKIARIGISLGFLALMSRPDNAAALGGMPEHTSTFTHPDIANPPGGHYSHGSHASHASHSNHGSGNWC
ncbi:MAG: hypothetical protein Q8O22_05540 [Candidatus Omnitrophota bacterium]|nr:hypothetical protein [Candidatus Omnitrophota bacterium]